MPPGNRLEALRGQWKGYHSIRVNDRWRVVFRWKDGNASGFHPGEILLEEFLAPGGITQTAFAEKLGWTRARPNELMGDHYNRSCSCGHEWMERCGGVIVAIAIPTLTTPIRSARR
jgi:hypothetical protein